MVFILSQTLKTLNLAANRIGPDGAQHLADALRKNEVGKLFI